MIGGGQRLEGTRNHFAHHGLRSTNINLRPPGVGANANLHSSPHPQWDVHVFLIWKVIGRSRLVLTRTRTERPMIWIPGKLQRIHGSQFAQYGDQDFSRLGRSAELGITLGEAVVFSVAPSLLHPRTSTVAAEAQELLRPGRKSSRS